ncbi:hypothetical protein KL918_000752 [Ogataea parapolymorpha]|uniref:Nuclear protein STH1/NPS1 n=1 Tax=Ogataea parapolymorpha (strain ATCC 26012 / BCRC 20466 / JCM 22074 / NRRL Y-7560 / DL-1) TaxID=871575 RepID=W1Q9W9_OGAPD|nr:Nuclear protein STH1/NPS1 [Ogataea parapolymorpha DL-1]ESW97143.1 Nuclear protein STH1/NPS1 [Ogataea parapolymorpha DL-1]KAG7869207.1 hypothetical protein KL918_000752 [Ogataea parapolymorpha]KAG7875741.1 hypothetical protein KL916_000412 [Ogataea parapolymorpha]
MSDEVQNGKTAVEIAYPSTVHDVHRLLSRLAVSNKDIEKKKILKILQQLAKERQKYEEKSIDLEKSWAQNKEVVDLDLLKVQVMAFNLLSKDLDLPLEVQTKLVGETDVESLKGQANDNGIPVDFNEKAKLFGLDPHKTVPDPEIHSAGSTLGESLVKQKVESRIHELENLPANIGLYDASSIENDLEKSASDILDNVDEIKIRALNELKALKLLPEQKQLRRKLIQDCLTSVVHQKNKYGSDSFRAFKRSFSIRDKQKIEQTSRLAEKLQEQQRREKEELEHDYQTHKVNKLAAIFDEVRDELEEKRNARHFLAKALQHFHSQVEKDESKKLERIAKQRLAALRSNDEEAYMQLLTKTKDTRLHHLIQQTNNFLDSLANAVKVQQDEARARSLQDRAEEGLEPLQEDTEEDADARREKIDYYEVAHRVKEKIEKQPSLLVGGTLKEYQLKGLEWMVSLYNNNLNGILADEMGLGKTIQSISLITYLIESKKERGKFLVIVPLSTITNWTLEFERWAPSVKTIVYKGTQHQRKQLQYEVRSGNFSVLLTTYEYVIRDRPLLCKFKWAHMIIDEGHRMKNASSKLSLTLTQYYHTRNRLILTGTPLQNNLPELWALLNFVLPKVFNSVKSFDEWFNTPFANTGHQDKLELSEEESLLIIRRLHKVLRPFLLRRLKKDVEKDLPDKVERVVKCKLSGLQSCLYKQMLNHNALFVGVGTQGATKTGLRGLNNKIMQLRKVCNHPYVFEEVEDIVNPSRLTTDLIWRSSGKFELLDRVLPKFKASGHKVLIFFQMTQVMDIMEDYLRFRDMKYMRLDGSTKADDRQDMLKDFNAPDSEYFCFLLSTRAGGLGLNLQTADTVIIFDTDWNPHQDLQAQDRAHRIGQKNEVRILRLITEDSVEEVILERAHQKLDIDGKVIQAGKFDNKSSAEEQEAFLKRLLEAEKMKAEEAENDDLDDEELNEILARNEDEKKLFAEIDQARIRDDQKLDGPRLMSYEELPPVFKEDITLHLEKDKPDAGIKRERKQVVYDDGLTEEQWLDAMDAENDTVEAAALRKRETMRQRRAKRSAGADEEEEETPRKRRSTKSATPMSEESFVEEEEDDDAGEEPFVELCEGLLQKLVNATDENGRSRSELFMTVPSKKLYPDYYQIVKKAVAIKDLQKGLKKGSIVDYQQFKEELQQMFDNAKLYNEDGSLVYNDAIELEKIAKDELGRIDAELGEE